MDLAVVIDGDHPHDSLCLTVASEQHRPWADTIRDCGVGERRPAEAVIVLCVDVCC